MDDYAMHMQPMKVFRIQEDTTIKTLESPGVNINHKKPDDCQVL